MSERPAQKCDLVMKGGITSGIVYPPAVCKLQETFAFKNIGGTSAGAMAAAAVAAAEYNRAGGGFQALNAIHDELREDGNLLRLFQPQPGEHGEPGTRPLYDILIEILRALPSGPAMPGVQAMKDVATTSLPGMALPPLPLSLRLLRGLLNGKMPTKTLDVSLRVVNALSRQWAKPETRYQAFIDGGRAGVLIAGVGTLFLLLLPLIALLAFALSTHTWWPLALYALLVFLFVCLAGWIGLWVGRIIGVAAALPEQLGKEHYYGICNGHTPVPDERNDNSNLTDWLSSRLDMVAGLSRERAPLTFKHLREQDIDLQMVTSNISLGLPYVMPQELANYLFCADEWRRFFPEYVVHHMVQHSPRAPLVDPRFLPDGYYFLPNQENLPVVVCTRMSLSFPLLLCAVPLYTLNSAAYARCLSKEQSGRLDARNDLQRHWFSDGGLCSNFPIHFFDAWLPRRPTFGINLTGKPGATSALASSDHPPLPAENDASVYLMPAEEQPAPEWHDISALFAFLQSIFHVAQNYRDTMQSRLPSYRERIVQIRLDANEGGMNLTMDLATISHASQKGVLAADVLRAQFNFDHHWWVRFLVLMGRLEEQFEHLQQFLDGAVTPSLRERVSYACASRLSRASYPYTQDKDEHWCEEALRRLEILQDFLQTWYNVSARSGRPTLFREGSPLPEPVLRVTPKL